MPAFGYDPFNPGATYLDPARNKAAKGPGGFTRVEKEQEEDDGGGGGGAAPVTAAPKPPKKKKPGKKKPPKREAYNPLTAPFLTPRQIREEAARLAALSVANEQALRDESARQVSGIDQLSGALTGTLTGIGERQAAAMQGLGGLYNTIAQGAQQAGQTAAAAAGAPTEIAQGATPMVAASMANLTAPLQGYAPAAAATGARLVGEARGSLTKALAERANQISQNTAKYLQQLQGLEYEKAVAQETARQNAARLGLSAQESEFEQNLALQKLDLDRQKVAQGWYRAETARAKAAQTGNKNTDARRAQESVLENLDKWTAASSTLGEYQVTAELPGEGIQTVTVQAASPSDAQQVAKSQYPDTFGSLQNVPINALYQGPAPGAARAADSVWRARVRNYLMVAGGMTKQQANAFINKRIAPMVG